MRQVKLLRIDLLSKLVYHASLGYIKEFYGAFVPTTEAGINKSR